jgi:toxin ParE1/3/4
MNIELSESALQDLEELRIYLGERLHAGLANVLEDMEKTIRDIPQNLMPGRRTPRDDVRERISARYNFIIPYTVRDRTLYVLRIYHPKRKPLTYSAED